MSIEDLWQKIKGWGRRIKELDFLRFFSRPNLPNLNEEVFFILVVMLVAFGSFGLGRLSKIESTKTPVRIENAPIVTDETFKMLGADSSKPNSLSANVAEMTSEAELVGSKNGTKYHYPWCSGANRITESNRIYFASKSDAEKAGYTPASNCKGL
ncbi:MAG: hypothetical protein AAB552_00720 [Patescibacteria group bacterium]